MNRIWSRPWTLALCALPLIAALLLAADASAPTAPVPSWKNKPIPQWTEEESKQVLVDSPWVKWSEPVWLRDLSVEERIESGDWQATEGHGVGFEALLGLMADPSARRKPSHAPTPNPNPAR